jgi:4'-phosphopantetheinyl transferase
MDNPSTVMAAPWNKARESGLVPAGRWTWDGLTGAIGRLPRLGPGEAVVWRLDQPFDRPLARDVAPWLDAEEAVRAARFVRAADRRRFRLAHAAMRLILAAQAGVTPADVTYAVSDRGKPRPVGLGLHCNLSHAGDCVLVAVSPGGPVGVDVEAVRAMVDGDELVERFFAVEERLAYRALPEARRMEAFFAAWTRKEAYVKALGGGLSIALDAFAVSLDRPARLVRAYAAAPAARVRLWDLPVPAGLAAALAGGAGRVLCRELALCAAIDADGA